MRKQLRVSFIYIAMLTAARSFHTQFIETQTNGYQIYDSLIVLLCKIIHACGACMHKTSSCYTAHLFYTAICSESDDAARMFDAERRRCS
jgi:hypothetical protein